LAHIYRGLEVAATFWVLETPQCWLPLDYLNTVVPTDRQASKTNKNNLLGEGNYY